MKTLTLRNIPEDVQKIINNQRFWKEPSSRLIFELIRKVPSLNKKIAELQAQINDSK